jgi:hypothetical protein
MKAETVKGFWERELIEAFSDMFNQGELGGKTP